MFVCAHVDNSVGLFLYSMSVSDEVDARSQAEEDTDTRLNCNSTASDKQVEHFEPKLLPHIAEIYHKPQKVPWIHNRRENSAPVTGTCD